jgi:allophanate hydrolase
MEPGLKVVSPGLHTTVQDLGRFGYQALGVPVSGALDGFSLRLANALVGNPPGAAALEFLLSGATLEVVAERVRVALAAAGAVLSPAGGPPLPAWESRTFRRGDILRVVLGTRSGCAYLAVEGGIAVEPVLGSCATYTRACLGGFQGRALRQGDIVPVAVARTAVGTELRLSPPSPAAPDRPVRVVLGPQEEYFTADAISTLLACDFRVSPSSDRMGMRLDGPALQHRRGWDIASDAIATGAVQVPGSGHPIMLLADHQTTGGYPKIATVISADLPAVGRRRPGDTVRFTAVTAEAAEQLCRDQERELAALIAAIEPVPESGGFDAASLYSANLISGVSNGGEEL